MLVTFTKVQLNLHRNIFGRTNVFVWFGWLVGCCGGGGGDTVLFFI